MRTFNSTGIVIKRISVGEADRIVTIFTKKYGKIRAKAKGVRKITSRRSAHIELLNHSSFSFHKGKILPILTEVSSLADFSGIKEDLTKVGFAYHICELIDGLCAENQEHPFVFDLLLETLHRLEKEEDIAGIIHEFEIELLTKLGFYKRSGNAHRFDASVFIESLLERKLKSKSLFSKFS